MSVEAALRSITALIVACCDPDEIVLFGSHAKGLAGPHSDIDLLVVAPFREPPQLRGGELRGLLEQFPIPIDLHLLTRSEFEAARWQPRSFPSSIRASAIALYKKPPPQSALAAPRRRCSACCQEEKRKSTKDQSA